MNKLDRYYAVRDQIKTGDAFQWSGKGVLPFLIKIWSKKYNHTSLVLRLEEFEGLKDRVFLLEALKGGIVLTLVSERLKEYDGDVDWFPVRPIFDPFRNRVAEWGLLKVGTEYDKESLIKNAIKRVSADAEKLFCSEFYYLDWSEVLNFDFGMDKAPRPGDVEKMGFFLPTVPILRRGE